MKEERWKQAVEKISKNAGYATNADACEKALRQDTAQGYRDALREVSKHPYYLVNETAVREALGE